MGLFVAVGLVFMTIRTLMSLNNKEWIERHNKDGMMGGYLISVLVIEIIFLVLVLK